MRHSHVAHLIEAGVDPLTISRRLGHATVASTLDRYGHLFDQAGASAARAIGDLLGDGTEPEGPESHKGERASTCTTLWATTERFADSRRLHR